MRKRSKLFHCRGVTLLECLIYSALLSVLSVWTMRIIGESRVLRANARDRAAMTLIAQSELERLRTVSASELQEGKNEFHREEWLDGVNASVELVPREDGGWLIDVRVSRESIEGKPRVRLTTIRHGEAR